MTLRAVVMAAMAAMAVALVAMPAAVVPVRAQQPPLQAAAAGELRVLPVRGNIYLMSGAGGNITASVGKDGVLLVDSGLAAMARQAARRGARPVAPGDGAARRREVVRRRRAGMPVVEQFELLPATTSPRAPRPIAAIVNTSDDAGPHRRQRRQSAPQAARFGVRNLDNTMPGAAVVAHENAALRLSQGRISRSCAAERDLLRPREEAELLQRRGRGRHASRLGAHRRRQHGVFPRLRRARRRRRVQHDQLPGHRRRARRHGSTGSSRRSTGFSTSAWSST